MIEPGWFDIERIEVTASKATVIAATPTGGPANRAETAPTR